jgi:hypothetical protein
MRLNRPHLSIKLLSLLEGGTTLCNTLPTGAILAVLILVTA